MQTTDLPLTSDERFHEIAAILAAGLLKLRTRRNVAQMSANSGEQAPLPTPAELPQKALGFFRSLSPDGYDGQQRPAT